MNKTGYPHIEKPWLKYYTEDAISLPLPEGTIFDYVWRNNQEYLDDVALNFFDYEVTYQEFFENVEKAAKSFAALGVGKGDVVTIQALSLPQVIYMIYAVSRIGAIANLVYVTLQPDEVRQNLIDTKSKVYVAMDYIINGLDKAICNEFSRKIISLSIEDIMQENNKKTAIITDESFNVLSWQSFLSIGSMHEYEESTDSFCPAIMVYTGGTTGKSKAVMLSNQNLNVAALQYLYLGFERHGKFLSVLPPFIAFGLTVTLHMPLVFGLETTLCISPNPMAMTEFVEKYSPNYIICGTAQAEKMMNSLNEKDIDLSQLSFLGVGGEALSLALESNINDFLEKHNSQTKVVQGYAMSETSASSTAAIHTIHKEGTVGIPFVYTNIKIIDADTNKELPYNEKGEICINSPCMMMRYFENEEETQNVIKLHDDGKLWVHTGDIGSIDCDGFLTIAGRIKRIILVSEGDLFHKVFPKVIEEKILKLECIKAISVVGKHNEEKTNDLIAFIVLSDNANQEEAMLELEKYTESEFENYERPTKYITVDTLPLTTVGKVDYRILEEIAKES